MVLESNSVASMLPSDKAFCQKTVKSLLQSKCANSFKEPVDPVYYNIPDYFDIVKKPMDLSTIQNKLDNNQYHTIAEFTADIDLMFQNCYLYNNQTDPVCYDARVLQNLFSKLLENAKASGINITPKAKKEPARATPQPITPISNDSYNDDERKYGTLSDLDDQQSVKDTTKEHDSFNDDVFSEEELSEEEKEDKTKQINRKSEKKVDEEEKTKQIDKKIEKQAPREEGDNTEQDEKMGVKRAQKDDEMTEEHKKRCSTIIRELKKAKYNDITWAFKSPVDPQLWGCTDYYDIVKHPMDMSTYEQKFITNQYQHEDQLASDIQLMLDNCYLYNPPDNPVHQSAKELEQVFHNYWDKLHTTAIEERPKKKVKTKNTKDLKVDSNKSSKPVANILRVKLSSKPKAETDIDKKKIKLTLNTEKSFSPMDNNIPSASKATYSQDISSSPSLQAKNNQCVSSSHVIDNLDSPSSSSHATNNQGVSSSSHPTNIYPSDHQRKASLSSISSSSSSSSVRPKLAIDPSPPPLAIESVSKYHPHRRTSSSSSSSTTSSINDYKFGADGYSIASSSKAPPLMHRRDSSSSLTSMNNSNQPSNNHPSAPHTHRRLSSGKLSLHGQHKSHKLDKSYHRPAKKTGAQIISVFDLVDKIEAENKMLNEKAEQDRREYKRRMSEERERERITDEQKEERKRADREKRLVELNAGTLDISKQKIQLNQFEREVLRIDKDFRGLHHYYANTNDYRTLVLPGFINRLDIDMNQIQHSLLSTAGRYVDVDQASDMEMEETGMEELD